MSDAPAQFGDFGDEYRDAVQSAASIIPVPYDQTSTWRKGADKGPAAILEASFALENYDIETGMEPYRRGIYTEPPVLCGGTPEDLVESVDFRVGACLDRGPMPIVLGGEHTVSIGAVRACAARYPKLTVLQIDAHADTRETYHGSRFNHACVMARVREKCPVVQVGIRSIDIEERAGLDPARVFWGHEIAGNPDRRWIDRAVGLLGREVYVTIDLDGFDPSLVPATGTPEPGGLSWAEVNALLAKVCATKDVVGFDVVELLPQTGDHASAFLAAKLVYRMLAMIAKARTPAK